MAGVTIGLSTIASEEEFRRRAEGLLDQGELTAAVERQFDRWCEELNVHSLTRDRVVCEVLALPGVQRVITERQQRVALEARLADEQEQRRRLEEELAVLRRHVDGSSTTPVIGKQQPTKATRGGVALTVKPTVDDYTINNQRFRMDFITIPAGRFFMGSPKEELESRPRERPRHEVRIPSFALGRHPVTVAQWLVVMGSDPSHFQCNDSPVEMVSWEDAQEFIRRLNQATGNNRYRLPSEAEWEYACRAGTTTPFNCGMTLNTDQANYDGKFPYDGGAPGTYRKETSPTGTFPANPWGLCDMHGNVWEWCQDLWHDTYKGAPVDGNAWENGSSTDRVVRGGSWRRGARYCRSASRNGREPGARRSNLGFRLVRISRP